MLLQSPLLKLLWLSACCLHSALAATELNSSTPTHQTSSARLLLATHNRIFWYYYLTDKFRVLHHAPVRKSLQAGLWL